MSNTINSNTPKTDKEPAQEKSFFERLGELLNQPLPGTEITATDSAKANISKI